MGRFKNHAMHINQTRRLESQFIDIEAGMSSQKTCYSVLRRYKNTHAECLKSTRNSIIYFM